MNIIEEVTMISTFEGGGEHLEIVTDGMISDLSIDLNMVCRHNNGDVLVELYLNPSVIRISEPTQVELFLEYDVPHFALFPYRYGPTLLRTLME